MNQINFYFKNYTKQKIPRGYFLLILKKFLHKIKIKPNIELSLILVGKNKIKSLNKKHRRKNNPTDVLSFPIDIIKPNNISKEKDIVLGDIVICPIMVEKGELKKTFLHGLIHLFGYDHEKNQKEWKKIENKILKNI